MKVPDNKRNAPGRDGRKYCVYKHTLPDGRYYIGATYRGTKRWGKDGCNYKSSKLFYPLIQQLGWDNIQHEILFSNLSSREARKKEKELIIDAQKKGVSLNIRRGGYNAIYKEQIHEIVALRELGLSYTEIGKMYNIPADSAMAIFKKKWYLNYYSEKEFAAKVALFMSENKGKYVRRDGLSPNHNGHLAKRVIQKDKNKNIVARFESITEAARLNGVLVTSITNNLKGLSRFCGGYKYEYE